MSGIQQGVAARRSGAPAVAAPLAIGLIGVALLVWFDSGPPLAFNDDWVYAWTVKQFGAGHGIRVFPLVGAHGVPQLALGALVSLGHADPRLLRLSLVGWVLLACVASWGLARELGANRYWAVVAGVAPLGSTLFLSLATSFMTDVPYVSLLVSATWLGLRWLRTGRGIGLTVLLVALAVAQRQVGIALPLGVAAAVAVKWRGDTARRTAEAVGVAAMFAAVVVTLVLLPVVGFRSSEGILLDQLVHTAPARLVRLPVPFMLFATPVLGLFLMPFAGWLFLAPAPTGRASRAGVAVALAAVVIGAYYLVVAHTVFAGDYLTRAGVGPAHVPAIAGTLTWDSPRVSLATKSHLFPQALFVPLEVACLVTGAAALWRGVAAMPGLDAGRVAIATIIAIELLLTSLNSFLDRYYLPLLLPLVPLAAAAASHVSVARWGSAIPLVAICAGLLGYGVGEQDYQAWQLARDVEARAVYQAHPVAAVDAGYEAVGVYYWLPLYERTGRFDIKALIFGAHYTVHLQFAARDSPEPGQAYSSAAPGKIIARSGPGP